MPRPRIKLGTPRFSVPKMKLEVVTMITDFLQSRREGTAPTMLRFYRAFLTNASPLIGLDVTRNNINDFLKSLECKSGGKHAYLRTLRALRLTVWCKTLIRMVLLLWSAG